MNYQLILENLEHTGIGAAIFVCAYLANMLFGLFYNINVLGQQFDVNRLYQSAIKVACVAGGSILLSITITILPQFATLVGWVIPEEFTEVFQALAVIGIFLYSSCKYAVEALGKLKNILNVN